MTMRIEMEPSVRLLTCTQRRPACVSIVRATPGIIDPLSRESHLSVVAMSHVSRPALLARGQLCGRLSLSAHSGQADPIGGRE